MGIDTGNPAEAAAAEHAAKMERQRNVDAKVAGISGNAGETRSQAEIRAQAERELDAGITGSSSSDKPPVYFRRYDEKSWPNQKAWEAEHAEEMGKQVEIIRAELKKFGKTQSEETTRWQAMARIQSRQEGERLVESGGMEKLIDRAIDEFLHLGYRRNERATDRRLIEKHHVALRQAIFDRLKAQPVNPDDHSKTTTDYLSGIVSNLVFDMAREEKNS